MDLKTFIQGTLLQIIEGTKAASNKIDSVGQNDENGCINPQGETDLSIQNVSFDVALTVEESQGSSQGKENATNGKIQIANLLGIGHKRGTVNSEELRELSQSVCRIKFEIPLRLPASIDRKKNDLNTKKAAMLKNLNHMAR